MHLRSRLLHVSLGLELFGESARAEGKRQGRHWSAFGSSEIGERGIDSKGGKRKKEREDGVCCGTHEGKWSVYVQQVSIPLIFGQGAQ